MDFATNNKTVHILKLEKPKIKYHRNRIAIRKSCAKEKSKTKLRSESIIKKE